MNKILWSCVLRPNNLLKINYISPGTGIYLRSVRPSGKWTSKQNQKWERLWGKACRKRRRSGEAGGGGEGGLRVAAVRLWASLAGPAGRRLALGRGGRPGLTAAQSGASAGGVVTVRGV